MYKAMCAFVDSTVGEAPTAIEKTRAADDRREARRVAMDFLHNLVRLAMREGVGRHYRERGWPVVQDEVRPNPVKSGAPVSDTILTREQ
jgi:hypothetical protein